MANDNTTLADIAQRRLEAETKQLSEDIRTILGDIEASIEVRRMPEVVFVDYYLDNFRNIAITGDIDNSVTLAWINFAGGQIGRAHV